MFCEALKNLNTLEKQQLTDKIDLHVISGCNIKQMPLRISKLKFHSYKDLITLLTEDYADDEEIALYVQVHSQASLK